MYFLRTCESHSTIQNLIVELGFTNCFKKFCVQDLMGGSEIIAALRNGATSSITPTLLLQRYKYTRRISFALALASLMIVYS